MKDVSVEVKKDGTGCTLWLFHTIEALHVWREDFKADPSSLAQLKAQGNVQRFDFCAGENFRVKWLGCDVTYAERGEHAIYNMVCLHTVQQTTGDPIHRLFKGYISKEILPLEAFNGDNIAVVETIDPDEIEVEVVYEESSKSSDVPSK